MLVLKCYLCVGRHGGALLLTGHLFGAYPAASIDHPSDNYLRSKWFVERTACWVMCIRVTVALKFWIWSVLASNARAYMHDIVRPLGAVISQGRNPRLILRYRVINVITSFLQSAYIFLLFILTASVNASSVNWCMAECYGKGDQHHPMGPCRSGKDRLNSSGCYTRVVNEISLCFVVSCRQMHTWCHCRISARECCWRKIW